MPVPTPDNPTPALPETLCKSCGRKVVWAKTENNRDCPYDAGTMYLAKTHAGDGKMRACQTTLAASVRDAASWLSAFFQTITERPCPRRSWRPARPSAFAGTSEGQSIPPGSSTWALCQRARCIGVSCRTPATASWMLCRGTKAKRCMSTLGVRPYSRSSVLIANVRFGRPTGRAFPPKKSGRNAA